MNTKLTLSMAESTIERAKQAARARNTSVSALLAGLKSRGVMGKNLHGAHRLLANCLRVTVGAPEEKRPLPLALALVL